MGYSKLFDSMWSGSLYGQFEASAVFMVMLSLSDQHGNVDMSHEAIAGRTGWPIEFIREGIKQLESSDPRSRTPDADGRRIILLDTHRDWGWMITNYEKYREIERSIERREYLRQAKKKERETRRQQVSTVVNKSTPHMHMHRQSISKKDKTAYEVLEAVKAGYPAGTYGAQNWILAEKEVDKLLEAGETSEAITSAALAYRAQMDAKGSTGTQFVRSPEKFFGDGFWRGPFPLPKKPAGEIGAEEWPKVRAAIRDADLRKTLPPNLTAIVGELGGWQTLGECDSFRIEQKRKEFIAAFGRTK